MEDREFDQAPTEVNSEPVEEPQSSTENAERVSRPQKRRRKRAFKIVLLLVGLFLVFGIGAVSGGGLVYIMMEGQTYHNSRVIVVPDGREFFEYGTSPRILRDFSMPRSFAYRFPAGRLKHGTFVLAVADDSSASDAGLEEGELMVFPYRKLHADYPS